MTDTTNQDSTADTVSTPVQTPDIQANFDNTVDLKDFKFSFREDKDLGGKRPTVELKLPVPSVEGVIEILKAGGKQLDLLLDAVAQVVVDQARSVINDNAKITGQVDFPMDQVTWAFISTIPPKERRGGGIAKELWEEFGKDYIAVMPAVTGKSAEQIGNATKLLLAKFQPVKTVKPVISLLKDQLAMYVEHSPNAEQYAECISFLVEKADSLLNVDEATLLQNL